MFLCNGKTNKYHYIILNFPRKRRATLLNFNVLLATKKLNSKIDFEYKLMKTDSRKKEFKDYQENK